MPRIDALRKFDDGGAELETRERLLSEAERMFASRGYTSASVRRITESAGANVAAVSYYFGGKEGLYRAVFARLLEETRERRIRRIEADLEAAGERVVLEEFLRGFAGAFIEPLVDGQRGADFMALFDHEMRLRKLPASMLFEQLVEPMLELFVSSLERLGVTLEKRTAAMCLMSLVGQLAHALKAVPRFGVDAPSESLRLTLEDSIEHIVRFSAAGIRDCAADDASQTDGVGG
jgi:AcrR family transcriptional regulator